MNSIFISHSSNDAGLATRIISWLKAVGYESVFLDFDPDKGIRPGTKWESELYRHLQCSGAVIFLCTKSWLVSKWCFAEAVHAKMMGKYIIPLLFHDNSLPDLLREHQALHFDPEQQSSYVALQDCLMRLGLDPHVSFSSNLLRPPYPGLSPHDVNDAAVFFGRDEEVRSISEVFNFIWERRDDPAQAKFIVIIGASGSGKSSLARAGVLASLRKQTTRWLVADPVVPQMGRPLNLPTLTGDLSNFDGPPHKQSYDAPIPVVLIDQLEQLLTGPHQGIKDLCAFLADTTWMKVVIATLRSDYLQEFQNDADLRNHAYIPQLLGPIQRSALREIIIRPAEIHGFRMQPALVDNLVHDFHGDGSLPLLAFALRDIYERRGQTNELGADLYRAKGGLEGLLEQRWKSLCAGCSAIELDALRTSLSLLLEFSSAGQLVRQPLAMSKIPSNAERILNLLVATRFLTANEGELHIAHERLFYEWSFLKSVTDEYKDFLWWRRQLKQAREHWAAFKCQSDGLLPESALNEACAWADKHPNLLDNADLDFIARSRQRRTQRLALEDEQRKRDAEYMSTLERKNYQLTQLSDMLRVQKCEDEAALLWPAWPEIVPNMKDWLQRTAHLLTRLDTHQQTLTQLRHKAGQPQAPIGNTQSEFPKAAFQDVVDQWHYESLETLVEKLFSLQTKTAPDVQRRMMFAERVYNATISDYRQEWDAVCNGVSQSAVYRSLKIEPQLGLIPLGADPSSGLQEFLHLQSHNGPLPTRDAYGALTIHERTGIILILLPGGTFLMGAQKTCRAAPNYDPLALPDEGPVNKVEIAPFFLSKYQITQAQWIEATGVNPSYWNPKRAPNFINLRNPVEQISFYEADITLQRLGLTLPTEAQWEYGCRAGSSSVFHTGNTKKGLDAYANLKDRSYHLGYPIAVPGQYEKSLDSGFIYHAPVGSLQPNSFGLHDMHGNIWEWCKDFFLNYSNTTLGPTGERHCIDEPPTERVCRGGSFAYLAAGARSASRLRNNPNRRDYVLGARPAMMLNENKQRLPITK